MSARRQKDWGASRASARSCGERSIWGAYNGFGIEWEGAERDGSGRGWAGRGFFNRCAQESSVEVERSGL
jgi:hypothetical protein